MNKRVFIFLNEYIGKFVVKLYWNIHKNLKFHLCNYEIESLNLN